MRVLSKILPILSFIFLVGCAGLNKLSEVEQKSIRKSNSYPVEVADNFIWGINGHPITHLDYVVGNIEHQITLLKEHLLEYYRVDITTRNNGAIDTYPDKFEELLKIANKHQIKILPIIKIDKQLGDYSHTKEEAYNMGREQAHGFVKKYGSHFEYYELGNEQENKIIFKDKNGTATEHYDYQKLKILTAYFKGMIDGIKAINPKAKIMITGGWLHWGYFDLLEQEKVDYDIISYHWYSNMGSMFNAKWGGGNVIDTLTAKFSKPIWITEINKKDGSVNETYQEQAYWVEYFINELNQQPNINAFILYELYDQPNLYHQSWAGPGEASYGIVEWESTPEKYNEIRYKPVSNTLKFKIEEIKHGYENYVYAVLKHITQAVPDSEELDFWAKELQQHKSKEEFIKQLSSEKGIHFANAKFTQKQKELIPNAIDRAYNSFLNRKPSVNEVNYWTKKLKRKKHYIDQTLLLSKEYWENAIWNGYERRTGFKNQL